jgi:hypothetical protein
MGLHHLIGVDVSQPTADLSAWAARMHTHAFHRHHQKPSTHDAKGNVAMTTTERPEEVIRADHVPGPKQGEWTYSHYMAMPDDGQRYEIIDGVLYMSPSPNRGHQ